MTHPLTKLSWFSAINILYYWRRSTAKIETYIC